VSLEDARRRAAERVSSSQGSPLWERPEYVEDFAYFDPLLIGLIEAILRRRTLAELKALFERERRQQFKRRLNPRRTDNIRDFRYSHTLQESEVGQLHLTVVGDDVLLVVTKGCQVRLNLSREQWSCVTHEQGYDGCCALRGWCGIQGMHSHDYLTNVSEERKMAGITHAVFLKSDRRKVLLSWVEDAIILCADYFGIPDAEIESL
jgi:hypothetical protein